MTSPSSHPPASRPLEKRHLPAATPLETSLQLTDVDTDIPPCICRGRLVSHWSSVWSNTFTDEALEVGLREEGAEERRRKIR